MNVPCRSTQLAAPDRPSRLGMDIDRDASATAQGEIQIAARRTPCGR